MSEQTKREYIAILRQRYFADTSRRSRNLIISELCANTGMHRKSAIRCLRDPLKQKMRTRSGRGRKRIYSPDLVPVLKFIWAKSGQMCSKNLKQALPEWSAALPLPTEIRCQLSKLSPSTIERILKPHKVIYRRRRRSGTKPGTLLKNMIPIKTLGNIVDRAGHLEADTVAHCGGSLMGEFIWTLTMTDRFTGWTENRGVWGKSAKNVHEALEDIENNLPFEILSFNSDNGSEFLNQRIVEYFQVGGPRNRSRFVMTRSRSYHKNDNCHVEQKNWTHVRQVFGYQRFEFKELLPLMNEIYRIHNLWSNFFIPQQKLKSKVRIEAKIKKKYDLPQTPCNRLLADPNVSEETKERLKILKSQLNPFHLGDQRDALIAQFFHLKKQLESKKQDHPQKLRLVIAQGNIDQ